MRPGGMAQSKPQRIAAARIVLTRQRQPEKYRPLLLISFLCVFSIKAITPLGYMPTAVGNGWPFVLCDSVLPTAGSNGHAHHAQHDEQRSHWKNCPFGSAFAWSIPVEPVLDLGSLPGYLEWNAASVLLVGAPRHSSRARAPPHSLFVI